MGPMTKNHVFQENSAPPVANNSRHPITCFRTQKPTDPAYFDVNQTLLSRVRIIFCSFLTSKSSFHDFLMISEICLWFSCNYILRSFCPDENLIWWIFVFTGQSSNNQQFAFNFHGETFYEAFVLMKIWHGQYLSLRDRILMVNNLPLIISTLMQWRLTKPLMKENVRQNLSTKVCKSHKIQGIKNSQDFLGRKK